MKSSAKRRISSFSFSFSASIFLLTGTGASNRLLRRSGAKDAPVGVGGRELGAGFSGQEASIGPDPSAWVDAKASTVEAAWELVVSEEEGARFVHHSSGTTHDSSPLTMSYTLLSRYGRVESQ
jgi:hypothetical protein